MTRSNRNQYKWLPLKPPQAMKELRRPDHHVSIVGVAECVWGRIQVFQRYINQSLRTLKRRSECSAKRGRLGIFEFRAAAIADR